MSERETPVNRHAEFRGEFLHHSLNLGRGAGTQKMAEHHARSAVEEFPVQQGLNIPAHPCRGGTHHLDENDPPGHRRTIIGLGQRGQPAQQSGEGQTGTVAALHLFDRDRADLFSVVHGSHLVDAIFPESRQGTAHRSGNRPAISFGQHGAGDQGHVTVTLQVEVVTLFQFFPIQRGQQVGGTPPAAYAQDHIDFRIVPRRIKIFQPPLERSRQLPFLRTDERMRQNFDLVSGLFQQFEPARVGSAAGIRCRRNAGDRLDARRKHIGITPFPFGLFRVKFRILSHRQSGEQTQQQERNDQKPVHVLISKKQLNFISNTCHQLLNGIYYTS